MIQRIYYKKRLIGIRIGSGSLPKGSTPHTDPKEFVGLLTLKYPKGAIFKAHTHKKAKRVSYRLQECFIIRNGKVRIDLYGPDKKFFKYLYLKEGEAFLAVSGGHGFHVLRDLEMIEVKNGPYKNDKVYY